MDGVRAAHPTSSLTYFLGNSSSPCGFSSEGAGVTEEGWCPEETVSLPRTKQSFKPSAILSP